MVRRTHGTGETKADAIAETDTFSADDLQGRGNRSSFADDALLSTVERVERLEEEKKALADDIKEVYSEAKGTGFDTAIIRQLIRLRKMDPSDRKENSALLDTYETALNRAAGKAREKSVEEGGE